MNYLAFNILLKFASQLAEQLGFVSLYVRGCAGLFVFH